MDTRSDSNILVISDLHLGEDLKPTAAHVSYLRHLARLERELEAFLAHYTANRLDGRPWRLVVNGDMVDFMSILIMPEGENASVEERQYGLGYDETQSSAKLARVFDRHPGVFRHLSAFVEAGNELVIIVGNHDVEFYYPAVQRLFVDRLVELRQCGAAGGEVAPEPRDEASFRGAVRFCPWFYYEEDLVYVEHGHQYDEYCSFDYQLYPVQPVGGVALSVAHAAIRYFSNLVPTLDPHVGEVWGFSDYMRWGLAHGMRGLARIFFIYGFFCWKLIELWSGLTDRESDALRRERHRRAVREMADRYHIAVEKLEALDRLRCVPVVKRLFGILSTLFLDQVLVGMLGGTLALAGMIVAEGWLAKVGVVVGVVAIAAMVNLALRRKRLIPSSQALRRAPLAIWRILKAPIIVFGHSHSAERVQLDGGGVYFNTGTWAAPEEEASFPHLIIRAQTEPTAELHAWRDGTSAPIYP